MSSYSGAYSEKDFNDFLDRLANIERNVEKRMVALPKAYDFATKESGKGIKPLEHDTARYAIIYLQLFFYPDTWVLTPQVYNKDRSGIPDLVLETFRSSISPQDTLEDDLPFDPKIYIEFKGIHGKDILSAINQTHESVLSQKGKTYHEQGYIIGVAGDKWLFMEYNFGRSHSTGESVCQIYPLTASFQDSDLEYWNKNKSGQKLALPLLDTSFNKPWDGKDQNLDRYVFSFKKHWRHIGLILHSFAVTRGDYVRRWLKPTGDDARSMSTGPSYSDLMNLTKEHRKIWDLSRDDYRNKLTFSFLSSLRKVYKGPTNQNPYTIQSRSPSPSEEEEED